MTAGAMAGEVANEIALQALAVFLDTAPWLVVGLVAAGLVKTWMPADTIGRWLGGRGLRPTLLAALIGAPLPLCSCAVLPAAVSLRQNGAPREAVTAFLIATPETGPDSIALTYGMLGPFFAVIRPLAAIACAVTTGLLMLVLPPDRRPGVKPAATAAATAATAATATDATSECRTARCCGEGEIKPAGNGPFSRTATGRTLAGINYAFTSLFEDLAPWLALSLLVAAITAVLVPPHAMEGWGNGLPAMLAMLALSIPMYVCAAASTPLAAALLLTGVSPGAVMVFLLAGPATNLATIAVVRREFGGAASMVYLGGMIACSLATGLLTDLAAPLLFDPAILHPGINEAGINEAGMTLPSLAGAAVILVLIFRMGWSRLPAYFKPARQ